MARMTSKPTAIYKSIWLSIFKLIAPMIHISYQPRSPYFSLDTFHEQSPLIRILSCINKDPLYLSTTDGVIHQKYSMYVQRQMTNRKHINPCQYFHYLHIQQILSLPLE